MKFAILILGSPYSTQAPVTALHFCRAALAEGHEIYRVFLYGEGVHLATRLATPPQDELNIYNDWAKFVDEHKIDLVTCIAAAARRGIIDSAEAKRHEKDSDNMMAAYELSGLGQLVDTQIHADRLITFGS
jgi:tRNA 2-thiouridine synthesizing protein D